MRYPRIVAARTCEDGMFVVIPVRQRLHVAVNGIECLQDLEGMSRDALRPTRLPVGYARRCPFWPCLVEFFANTWEEARKQCRQPRHVLLLTTKAPGGGLLFLGALLHPGGLCHCWLAFQVLRMAQFSGSAQPRLSGEPAEGGQEYVSAVVWHTILVLTPATK